MNKETSFISPELISNKNLQYVLGVRNVLVCLIDRNKMFLRHVFIKRLAKDIVRNQLYDKKLERNDKVCLRGSLLSQILTA